MLPPSLPILDYVVLLCADLPRMKQFYHHVLGLPIRRDWDEWTELEAGAVMLALRPRDRPYDAPAEGKALAVQLAFRVPPADVERLYGELKQKNVEMLEAPKDKGYGHRTFFFRDPEGNLLEIFADVPVAQANQPLMKSDGSRRSTP